MKSIFSLLILSFFLISAMPATAALTSEERLEIQSTVEKAATLARNKPEKEFLSIIQNKEDFLQNNKHYVFVVNKNGIFMAHPEKPALVGNGGKTMKDTKGKLIIEEGFKIKTKGWIDYEWPNKNGTITKKSSYIMHVGKYLIGSGANY